MYYNVHNHFLFAPFISLTFGLKITCQNVKARGTVKCFKGEKCHYTHVPLCTISQGGGSEGGVAGAATGQRLYKRFLINKLPNIKYAYECWPHSLTQKAQHSHRHMNLN